MSKLKVGLVGIGGFGKTHLENLRILENEGRIQLHAVCDINAELYEENLNQFLFQHVRKYKEFDEFLKCEKGLDLVVVATPIPLHKDMCCKAMLAGYNVFLEKPPAVTVQDIDEMISAKKQSGKICAIGFQRTSQKSFVYLKEKLKQGIIGKIVGIQAAGIYKRTKVYYDRAPWVGKLIYNKNYVLDGTVNNPLSHLLNNCLQLAALQNHEYVAPDWVKGELYRSNPIEAEDTSCMRIKIKDVEIVFFATLCAKNPSECFIVIQGTEGSAFWSYTGEIEIKDPAGKVLERFEASQELSALYRMVRHEHYTNLLEYLEGKTNHLSCTLEDARNFVLCSNMAFESSKETHPVKMIYKEYLDKNNNPVEEIGEGHHYVHLKGIEDIIMKGIAEKKLYSEMKVEWSVETQPFNNNQYKEFKLYK